MYRILSALWRRREHRLCDHCVLGPGNLCNRRDNCLRLGGLGPEIKVRAWPTGLPSPTTATIVGDGGEGSGMLPSHLGLFGNAPHPPPSSAMAARAAECGDGYESSCVGSVAVGRD